jgi:putative NADH-flavin reductase
MKILVLGAAGGAGRQLASQAIAAGHRVTAFARDPSKLNMSAPDLVPFRADAGDAEALRRALDGQDAVICAMGNPTPRQRNPALVTAIAGLVKLMESAGPSRLLYLSTILVPESRARAGRLAATVAPLIIGNDISDHVDKEQAITKSTLDWTIVRPTKLSNGPPTGRYLAGTDAVASKALGLVSRSDLAHFMVDELANNRFVRAKPVVVM